MSVLVEFAMSPMDKGESLSKYVSRSIDIIDKSGVTYQLTPMGSILEGDYAEVMAVIEKCYEKMNEDCTRITCSIKMDIRKGKDGRLQQKIASVEKVLGRGVKT